MIKFTGNSSLGCDLRQYNLVVYFSLVVVTLVLNGCDNRAVDTHLDFGNNTDLFVDSPVANIVYLVANGRSVGTSLPDPFFSQNYLDELLGFAPSDKDGDGVVDAHDAFPNDPSEILDSDNDRVGDNSDYAVSDPTIQTVCQAHVSDREKEVAACHNRVPITGFTINQTLVASHSVVALNSDSNTDPDGDEISYLGWGSSKAERSIAIISLPSSNITPFTSVGLTDDYISRLTDIDDFGDAGRAEKTKTVDKDLPAAGGLLGVVLIITSLIIIYSRVKQTL